MRYCTSFNIAGTLSFRLASSKFLGVFGGNLQNSPPELLRCFTARPGCVFVQADQSGAEALVVAHIARAGTLRKLFTYKIKPHSFLATHLFAANLKASELTTLTVEQLAAREEWKALSKALQDPSGHYTKEYAIGKQTCHAANYGMGPGTFQTNALVRSEGKLALTTKEAKFFLDTYHKLFPEIHEWHDGVKALIYTTRTLHNLFGYPCTFHDRRTGSLLMQAYSWVPQSTVGVLTHLAALQFRRRYPKLGFVLNNKHDSYLVECREADAVDVGRKMQETIAEVELTGADGTKFRMKSEVQIGRNWGKYDPETNPEGMKAQ